MREPDSTCCCAQPGSSCKDTQILQPPAPDWCRHRSQTPPSSQNTNPHLPLVNCRLVQQLEHTAHHHRALASQRHGVNSGLLVPAGLNMLQWAQVNKEVRFGAGKVLPSRQCYSSIMLAQYYWTRHRIINGCETGGKQTHTRGNNHQACTAAHLSYPVIFAGSSLNSPGGPRYWG